MEDAEDEAEDAEDKDEAETEGEHDEDEMFDVLLVSLCRCKGSSWSSSTSSSCRCMHAFFRICISLVRFWTCSINMFRLSVDSRGHLRSSCNFLSICFWALSSR